jgi:hypothetical protein
VIRYYLASTWCSVAEQCRSQTTDEVLVITSEHQLRLCERAARRILDLGVDDEELAELLVGRGVLIRPGNELGMPGWARITVGPAEVMDRAAAALVTGRAELLGAGASAA